MVSPISISPPPSCSWWFPITTVLRRSPEPLNKHASPSEALQFIAIICCLLMCCGRWLRIDKTPTMRWPSICRTAWSNPSETIPLKNTSCYGLEQRNSWWGGCQATDVQAGHASSSLVATQLVSTFSPLSFQQSCLLFSWWEKLISSASEHLDAKPIYQKLSEKQSILCHLSSHILAMISHWHSPDLTGITKSPSALSITRYGSQLPPIDPCPDDNSLSIPWMRVGRAPPSYRTSQFID